MRYGWLLFVAPLFSQPLIDVTPNGSTFPGLADSVTVTAMAATKNGSTIYSASDIGIFRSPDGGATWTQQLPGLTGAISIAVDGADSNTVYAVLFNNATDLSLDVSKSMDGGQNWTAVTALPYLPFNIQPTLQCPAQLSGTVYASDQGLFRSRDSGATWVSIAPDHSNMFSFALAPSDPNVVYMISTSGLVYRSANGGDTWTAPGGTFPAYPNIDGDSYPMSLAVDPQDENTVWALKLDGNLFRSTDGGANFSIVLSDPAEQASVFLSLSPSGQGVILSSRGVNGANAIVTYDRGASWHRVNAAGINGVLAGQNGFFIETNVTAQSSPTKWSDDRNHMIFATFFARASLAVAYDSAGNRYTAGRTLTKFTPRGDVLFSQSLGVLTATAVAIDPSGDIYIAVQGPTLLKFDPLGNQIFSKPVPQALGSIDAIAFDANGAIHLFGATGSPR